MVWQIIIISLTVIFLIITIFMVVKSGHQFRDKSLNVKEGMSEDDVLMVMQSDPKYVEELKDGAYEWIYEIDQWVSWAMMTIKIEIIFDVNKKVTSIVRSKSYDRNKVKKD